MANIIIVTAQDLRNNPPSFSKEVSVPSIYDIQPYQDNNYPFINSVIYTSDKNWSAIYCNETVSQVITLVNKGTTPPLDPDAARYLTAANIAPGQVYAGNGTTDYPLASERIIAGVNNLFVSLKTAGLYSRIKYMYPFLGATNADNYVNAITPGTKDLTEVGAVTAAGSRLGFAFDGASELDTGILLSEFAENSLSAAYYHAKFGGGYDYGLQLVTGGGVQYAFGSQIASDFFFFRNAYQFDGTVTTTITVPSLGLNIMTATAPNTGVIYDRGTRNTSFTSTNDKPSSDFNPITLHLGLFNGFTSGYSSRTCGLFLMMDGIDDADAATLNSIIEQWAAGVGRNQGSNIYSFFGDSITSGQEASPLYHRWSTNVSFNKKAKEINYGAPGATIVTCNTTDISNLIPKDAVHTKVFLAYLTNDYITDFNSGGTSMNISLFSSTLATVLGKILGGGYLPGDIAVISGYYNGSATSTGSEGALQDTYIAAVASACASVGITNVFNLKPVMIAAGGDSLISSTGPHPNTAGYDVIGNYLTANLVGF